MPINEGPAINESTPPEGAFVSSVAAAPTANVAARPIIVNLGAAPRKRIKKLRRGTGPLVGEVHSAVEQVAADLSQEVDGQTLVPVVLLYKDKRRKRRGGPQGMCPFCCV